MLYECWRQIAGEHADELALVEMASVRRWRFRDLFAETERKEVDGMPVVFSPGVSAQFVLTVLRAWHGGGVVCPLERDQQPPVLSGPLPDGIAHLKTSSATTGAPRLIALTAAQMRADAENIVASMGLRPDWPNVGAISLGHSYGFSNLLLPLLLHGIPLVLAESALPESVRLAAKSFARVTLAAVPALWQTWYSADAIPPNVALAISAGSPLPLTLEKSVFESRGLKIHNFYGSSECGGIAYDASAHPRIDAACVGAPLRNVTVSVGEDRCLEVRSEAVAMGYWPAPSPALGNGVFRTSDLGEITDGLIYLRGRAGDQINVAGRKVSPEVIEEALVNHPWVRACLAFGVPGTSEHRGEMVVACVAAEAGVNAEGLK
ncbi:MAG: class I adenylate-forming enzyme family protein, partial [Limisphaerales bacterium]